MPDADPISGADGSLENLIDRARACRVCAADLPLGPRPMVFASTTARIMIVGQAPGTKVHETGIPWNDPSGNRLRDWLDLDRETFYDTSRIAIMPMGFCYPGREERGGDKPPRPECAPLWHDSIRAASPRLALTLLVGRYAQARYLGKARKRTLTDTVRAWRDYLPALPADAAPELAHHRLAREEPLVRGRGPARPARPGEGAVERLDAIGATAITAARQNRRTAGASGVTVKSAPARWSGG